MLNIRFFLVLTLIAAGQGSAATSSCPDMSEATPAMLVDTGEQHALASRLSPIWNSDEPGRLVRFGAYVGLNGKLTGICCVSSSINMNTSSERTLANRLAKLRFTPANHNGEDIRVFVGFTIIARRSESGIQSTLLMNRLLSSDKYGARYIAPQRIRDGVAGSLWAGGMRIEGPVWGEITADVDRTGSASNGRVSRWELGPKSKQKRLTGKFEHQCFIPGRVEGVAVAMPNSEVFQQ